MLTALLVIGILVLLIVVHEFGHFIVAKISGVGVEEFGVGYPPRAYLLGRFGGTDYTLNWIPFGGFVKLFGEDSPDQHGSGSFADAPRWKQAAILVAGVSMNIVMAWVLFTGAYATGILHVVDSVDVPGAQLLITDVVAGSPADAAGIAAGDTVLSITDSKGVEVVLTPDSVQNFVNSRGGKDLTVVYERAQATSTTTLRPAHAVVPGDAGRPAIGVGLAMVTSSAESIPVAMRDAAVSTYNAFGIVVGGLWKIINDSFHGRANLQSITGPVGIVGAVGDAAQNGFGYVLSLAAFISVNLAVINLIPIPALDGGRLVVVGIESVLRRIAPKLAIQLLNTIGMASIIILMIIVTYHDIARLLT